MLKKQRVCFMNRDRYCTCLPFSFSLEEGKKNLSRTNFCPKNWRGGQFQHENGLVTASGSKCSFFRHYHRTLQKLWLCSVSCKIWSNKIDYSYLLERPTKAICMFLIILQCMHTYTELIHNSVRPLMWISYRRILAKEDNGIYRCGGFRLPNPFIFPIVTYFRDRIDLDSNRVATNPM